jgi:AraC-like DNA-binding protein
MPSSPTSEPTIASGALRKLFSFVREMGFDAEAVRERANVPREVLDDVDARVTISMLHDAWEAVAERIPRDDAALLTAKHYAPGDYGLVGFVAMACPTLDAALEQVVRYVGIWTEEPEFLYDDGVLRLEHRFARTDRVGLRRGTEAAFAEILNAARLLTQTPELAPLAVVFEHPGPADPTAHEAFFGCPVRFGGAEHAMRFGPEALALEMPQVDPQLGEFLRARANEALRARGGNPASPLHRIREILAEELQRGVPTLPQIARRLATSERTLRRRLEEEGTSFREILDETRSRVAQKYVRDGSVSLAEVAFLVGFSETSAFNRAFKRWTGASPSAWRERQRRA